MQQNAFAAGSLSQTQLGSLHRSPYSIGGFQGMEEGEEERWIASS